MNIILDNPISCASWSRLKLVVRNYFKLDNNHILDHLYILIEKYYKKYYKKQNFVNYLYLATESQKLSRSLVFFIVSSKQLLLEPFV